MIGRLVNSADFERVLGARTWSRSDHFAVHHVHGQPLIAAKPRSKAPKSELSTDHAPVCPQAVDESPLGHWFGCVVPKRHARRSVTRSLLKRQIRNAFLRHAPGLPAGQWLVRLRQPFATKDFVSASSAALAHCARAELDSLLTRAAA